MNNTMMFGRYKASIRYDAEIGEFRGEFLGLNGGADFYGKSLAELKREGAASLKVFLEMCAEKGIEPEKDYSGRLMLRIPPTVHASAAHAAAAHGKSLNQWAAEVLMEAAESSHA
ncbi:MAG: type II toxin-antitoxin system HicB family antitoxin [Fibrobacteres bacterium]|nr:type II toxin-antitoxin system HicB family antitoxin [Fibrobacterota bacterium]